MRRPSPWAFSRAQCTATERVPIATLPIFGACFSAARNASWPACRAVTSAWWSASLVYLSIVMSIADAAPAAAPRIWPFALNDSGAVFLYDWRASAPETRTGTSSSDAVNARKATVASLRDLPHHGAQRDRLAFVGVDVRPVRARLHLRRHRHPALANATGIHRQLHDGHIVAFARLGVGNAAADEIHRRIDDQRDDPALLGFDLLRVADRRRPAADLEPSGN